MTYLISLALTFSLLFTTGCKDKKEQEDASPIFEVGENANLSFEEAGQGWDNLVIGDQAYFAPVEGDQYAVVTPGGAALEQLTEQLMKEDVSYSVTVWVRSLLDDSYINDLKQGIHRNGTSETASLELELFTPEGVLDSLTADIGPHSIMSEGRRVVGDDGFAVWIDGDYRMAPIAGVYQEIGSDPIDDPWLSMESRPDTGIAAKAFKSSQGWMATYGFQSVNEDGTDSQDDGAYRTEILTSRPTGAAPFYDWTDAEIIMTNMNVEHPSTFILDPYLFEDPATERLWMLNGGTPIQITELDPSTGELLGNPESLEINDNSPTAIANFAGDEWTLYSDGSKNEWFEGAAMLKNGDYYYLFVSYGALETHYTIRMGRSLSPTGPFLDKDGQDMVNYGSSFLLGDEGDHLVPGHPCFWEEDDKLFMGYDYRTEIVEGFLGETNDYGAIRPMHFVNNWPTIWTPITLTVSAADNPSAIGQEIGIRIRNTGTSNSILGIDHISVEAQ